MKTFRIFLFLVVSTIMMASSCKKDEPIIPPPNPVDTRITVKGSVDIKNAYIKNLSVGFVLQRDQWGNAIEALLLYTAHETYSSPAPSNFEFKIPKAISDTLVIGKYYDMCLGVDCTRNDSTLCFTSDGLTVMKNPLDMGVNFSNHINAK